jgi:hypothetical protein
VGAESAPSINQSTIFCALISASSAALFIKILAFLPQFLNASTLDFQNHRIKLPAALSGTPHSVSVEL